VDYRKLLGLSIAAARFSRDPSTQNGALLVGVQGIPLVTACNQFPTGVVESDERWERPLKYEFIEHAERNAILFAARHGIATEGLTMVCPWAACADCARAIVQAGIAKLVRLVQAPENTHERWAGTVSTSDTILIEGGVMVEDYDVPLGLHIRRNGGIITV
jgi:dCMP deaminase